ncbi:MAG: heme-copper oxidase subunit III [Lapillicoccus sp.]
MVAVGTIVWLSSELMFFAGLFAMYFQIRSLSPELWAEQTAKLNVPFASVNCLILVVSSLWCQLGVWKAEAGQKSRTGKVWQTGFVDGLRRGRADKPSWGMREWYVLTYLFGATFIAGQIFEYAELTSENVTLSSDRYGSVFFMTTGFHGMHVTGGLIAFLLIIGRTFTTRHYSHAQAIGAVVTSYYWHFVDVVWVALFATIYLLK